MSPFENLPLEIKNQIYGYLLIHHETITPFPAAYEREEIELDGGRASKRVASYYGGHGLPRPDLTKNRGCQHYDTELPSIALLGVSRAIQVGAARILFGKNTWRVSTIYVGYLERLRLDPYMDDVPAFSFFCQYHQYFQDLEMRFNMQDCPQSAMISCREDLLCYEPTYSTKDELKQRLHTCFLEYLLGFWEIRSQLIDNMNLKRVVYNLKDLYCPSGCCREEAFYHFVQYWSNLVGEADVFHIVFGYNTPVFQLKGKNKYLEDTYMTAFPLLEDDIEGHLSSRMHIILGLTADE